KSKAMFCQSQHSCFFFELMQLCVGVAVFYELPKSIPSKSDRYVFYFIMKPNQTGVRFLMIVLKT
ncbi:hypothetical protein, partial [Leuconostoc lactis]|uniref:hypothetical protein n=1 Tax=Leuconostoc lactis TaxID=1246 RepID=UPI00289B7AC7